jgi:hypothetical protein
MTTEKQIAANRLNGLKGGVKTSEGKARSKLNAVSHGLFTRNILLPGENAELLSQMRDKYHKELKPKGEIETLLVERIVSSAWRLNRVLKIDALTNMVKPKDEITDDFEYYGHYHFNNWQSYMRYETALENQIYKALRELNALQQERLCKPVDLDSIADNQLMKMLEAHWKDGRGPLCNNEPNSEANTLHNDESKPN